MAIDGKKICGLTLLCDFPYAPYAVWQLSKYVDYMYVGVDRKGGWFRGDGEGGKANWWLIRQMPFDIPVKFQHCDGFVDFRRADKLLREIDRDFPDTDYVINGDSDELLPPHDEFMREVTDFVSSGKTHMMFEFDMISADGRPVPLQPLERHCKVYKYTPKSLYGAQAVAWPRGKDAPPMDWYYAKSRIRHFWTIVEECERAKAMYYSKRRKMPGHVESLYYAAGPEAYEKWKKLYEPQFGDAPCRPHFTKVPWIVRRETERDYDGP